MEHLSLNRVTIESAVLLFTSEEGMPTRTEDSDTARQIAVAQATVSTAGDSNRSLHRSPFGRVMGQRNIFASMFRGLFSVV